LNALARNWRQKARISAKELDLSRPSAGEEKDAEVMVAMTRLLSLLAAYAALESPFLALNASFGLIY
jgi:hypothetical protein